MPRAARLTEIRRQARVACPYRLSYANQEGCDERRNSGIVAPRIRLSSIRRQARQASHPTNTTPAIHIDGQQQHSTVTTAPIVNRLPIGRQPGQASRPTNRTPGLQQHITLTTTPIVNRIPIRRQARQASRPTNTTPGNHIGGNLQVITRVFLPRIPLEPSENINLPFKLIRKQFPVRLCFAMTINKAQGQTIPFAGIYLEDHVFSHGQLYVALSRGVSMSSTKIVIREGKFQGKEGTYAKNIVYKEVLLN